MTLNTVKPRSAIRRLSPSMVCATDLLPGLVMTPSEDCVLSGIRLPSEVRRTCARPREQVVACFSVKNAWPASGERFTRLRAAPRLFDRITVADAPRRDQGVRPTRRKLVNRHDRSGAPALVPGTRDRGARSDGSILDLTIAATHIPHGIVSHRASSPSIGRTRS